MCLSHDHITIHCTSVVGNSALSTAYNRVQLTVYVMYRTLIVTALKLTTLERMEGFSVEGGVSSAILLNGSTLSSPILRNISLLMVWCWCLVHHKSPLPGAHSPTCSVSDVVPTTVPLGHTIVISSDSEHILCLWLQFTDSTISASTTGGVTTEWG